MDDAEIEGLLAYQGQLGEAQISKAVADVADKVKKTQQRLLHAEQKLQEERKTTRVLQSLLSTLPQSVLTLDREGRLTTYNRHPSEVLGCSVQHLQKMPFWQWDGSARNSGLVTALRWVFANGTKVHRENYEMYRSNRDDHITVNYTAFPLQLIPDRRKRKEQDKRAAACGDGVVLVIEGVEGRREMIHEMDKCEPGSSNSTSRSYATKDLSRSGPPLSTASAELVPKGCVSTPVDHILGLLTEATLVLGKRSGSSSGAKDEAQVHIQALLSRATHALRSHSNPHTPDLSDTAGATTDKDALVFAKEQAGQLQPLSRSQARNGTAAAEAETAAAPELARMRLAAQLRGDHAFASSSSSSSSSSGGGGGSIGTTVSSPISRNGARLRACRPYVGVVVQGAPSSARVRGVVVTDVVRDSPAQAAGLARGDLIVSVDALPTHTKQLFKSVMSKSIPGSVRTLNIIRGRRRKNLTLCVGAVGQTPSDYAELQLLASNGVDPGASADRVEHPPPSSQSLSLSSWLRRAVFDVSTPSCAQALKAPAAASASASSSSALSLDRMYAAHRSTLLEGVVAQLKREEQQRQKQHTTTPFPAASGTPKQNSASHLEEALSMENTKPNDAVDGSSSHSPNDSLTIEPHTSDPRKAHYPVIPKLDLRPVLQSLDLLTPAPGKKSSNNNNNKSHASKTTKGKGIGKGSRVSSKLSRKRGTTTSAGGWRAGTRDPQQPKRRASRRRSAAGSTEVPTSRQHQRHHPHETASQATTRSATAQSAFLAGLVAPARGLTHFQERLLKREYAALGEWGGCFDVWHVSSLTRAPLAFVFGAVLRRDGLVLDRNSSGSTSVNSSKGNSTTSFSVLPCVAANFARRLEALYATSRQNSFHNSARAADTLQAVHVLASAAAPALRLSAFERLCLYVACAARDCGHPGVSNSFLVGVGSGLAGLYPTGAALESYAASLAVGALGKEGAGGTDDVGAGLLAQLPVGQQALAKELIAKLIVGTDPANAFAALAQARQRRQRGDGCRGPEDRVALLQLLLLAADASHLARPRVAHLVWAQRMAAERHAQGKLESSLGLSVSFPHFMNQHPADLPRAMIAAIRHLAVPVFTELSRTCHQLGSGAGSNSVASKLKAPVACAESSLMMWEVAQMRLQAVGDPSDENTGQQGPEEHILFAELFLAATEDAEAQQRDRFARAAVRAAPASVAAGSNTSSGDGDDGSTGKRKPFVSSRWSSKVATNGAGVRRRSSITKAAGEVAAPSSSPETVPSSQFSGSGSRDSNNVSSSGGKQISGPLCRAMTTKYSRASISAAVAAARAEAEALGSGGGLHAKGGLKREKTWHAGNNKQKCDDVSQKRTGGSSGAAGSDPFAAAFAEVGVTLAAGADPGASSGSAETWY